MSVANGAGDSSDFHDSPITRQEKLPAVSVSHQSSLSSLIYFAWLLSILPNEHAEPLQFACAPPLTWFSASCQASERAQLFRPFRASRRDCRELSKPRPVVQLSSALDLSPSATAGPL